MTLSRAVSGSDSVDPVSNAATRPAQNAAPLGTDVVAYGFDMVVVGGVVVSGSCAGGGATVVGPRSSLVLTGVLGAVLMLGVVERDDTGFVGASGVSRSG